LLIEAVLCTELGKTPNSTELQEMFPEQKRALYNMILKTENIEIIRHKNKFLTECFKILNKSTEEILTKPHIDMIKQSCGNNIDLVIKHINKAVKAVKQADIGKLEEEYGLKYVDDTMKEENIKDSFEEQKNKLKIINDALTNKRNIK